MWRSRWASIIVPSTNPTSTTFYKSMIAIKSGNAIVFSPHPSAAKCLEGSPTNGPGSREVGAPEDVIGCISMPTMGATNELMHCRKYPSSLPPAAQEW